MDRYDSFAMLSRRETEGLDYRVHELRQDSFTVILAPHGGGIEPGTSEVARRIAGAEHSLAVFEGMKRSGNARLHITSTRFDEPRCLARVQAAERVVAIHGEGGDEAAVYLGGRDSALAARIRNALEREGYVVRTHPRSALHGLDPANICNRGATRAGVQIELSAGLRRTFFASLDAEGRRRPTAELARFAEAVRRALDRGSEANENGSRGSMTAGGDPQA